MSTTAEVVELEVVLEASIARETKSEHTLHKVENSAE